MKDKFAVFGLLSSVICCSMLLVSYTEKEESIVSEKEEVSQRVTSVFVDKAYAFAGENMPDHFDAKERLDRELTVNTYWHSSTILSLKLANRYFPTIERILREEGVPDDFKYLAVAESGLRNVTSSANAKGFWQFRKAAAKEWGLEVNDEVDERYHLEKATKAACGYLKWMKKKFGTWTNAAAAYNVGPTAFKKTLANQGEDSYYDLNLNAETGRYVFRIMAIKEVLSNPEQYGFFLNQEEKYASFGPLKQIEVSSSVASWSSWAEKRGMTYRELKIYNPWLRDNKLTVKKNVYQIKVEG